MKYSMNAQCVSKILAALFFLMTMVSCGSDDEESIFGAYELTEWELTSCRLVDNAQTAVLSTTGVCLFFQGNETEECVTIDITLNQDSTFLFQVESQDYDLQGNAVGEIEETMSNGAFRVAGNQMIFTINGSVVREYFFEPGGGFFRITQSVSGCDTRESYSKI